MKKIVFISTLHMEIGKCNADELFHIIEKIRPEVIFLEATKDTYSDYDRFLFEQFGVYHKKTEIKAIQKYSTNFSVKYIPVLDLYLPSSFDDKYNALCRNTEYKSMIDYSYSLISEHGFKFLNSSEGDILQEKFREFENTHFKDDIINKALDEGIDTYENSMIQNIFAYCNSNQFDSAIFMCGSAHRKSISSKVKKKLIDQGIHLNWQNFGS